MATWTTDPERLRGAIGQRAVAKAYDVTGSLLQELPVKNLSITYDTEWAPHVQAQLTSPIPSSGLNALDPRAEARVTLSAGYVDGAGEDVHQIADLGIRRRTVTRGPSDSVMALALASDEALMQDWVGLPPEVYPPYDYVTIAAGTHVAAALETLIQRAFAPGAPPGITSVAVDPSLTLDVPAVVTSGTAIWPLAAGLASYRDYLIYDPGNRTWIVKPRPQVTSTPKHRIAWGENLVASEASLSRDGDDDRLSWGNAVVAKWESSSTANPLENRGYALDPSYRRKVVTIDMGGAASSSFATRNARATAMLPRVMARGRELKVTAVNAWWLRPCDTVEVLLPTWDAARDMLVSRVTFNLPSGEMDVTLRHPDDAAITDGE